MRPAVEERTLHGVPCGLSAAVWCASCCGVPAPYSHSIRAPTPPGRQPSEKALALMTRGDTKHPFVAGIEDAM